MLRQMLADGITRWLYGFGIGLLCYWLGTLMGLGKEANTQNAIIVFCFAVLTCHPPNLPEENND